MTPTQDQCTSITVSRMRALGQVTEKMERVRVEIAGMTREVGLWHLNFPNGGSWSFVVRGAAGLRECSSCTRGLRAGAAPGSKGSPCPIVFSLATDRSGSSGCGRGLMAAQRAQDPGRDAG
jgi:hypothetical protein